MIQKEKCLVLDIDGTLCPIKRPEERYEDLPPNQAVVEKLRFYRTLGFYVILTTSRNMRTFDGNIGQITAKTLPGLLEWLASNDIPYDEIHVGKPWPGKGGIYVDDRALRPSEFVELSYEAASRLLVDEQTTLNTKREARSS